MAVADAEFYVRLRTKRDADGAVIATEFAQARRTKPEPGALRTGLDEAWIKVTAYVPPSIFYAGKKVGHDPVGLWATPLFPEDSELDTLEP